jgi:DNA-binding GntR family transcriptional regulator
MEGLVPSKPFQTKEEYIYDTLRTAILQCKIEPGARLVIDHLTSTFGSSTIPIRTALQRLQAEGLVEIVPHTGAVVSEISVDSIVEVFTILEALERVAFEKAAEKIQPDEFYELEQLMAAMEKAHQAGEIDRWSDLNGQFHHRIAVISGMKLLTDFMDRTLNYWGRVRCYYLAEIASERVPQAQADHRELLALLKAGKTGELVEKVAQHNRQALKAYQRLMQSSTFTLKH